MGNENMASYRKKPVVVKAWPFKEGVQTPGVQKGVYYTDAADFGGRRLVEWYYVITIHGQKTKVVDGDWIIEEPDGVHHYPCRPDVFAATYELATPAGKGTGEDGFQQGVDKWMIACFGKDVAYDTRERSFRFLEEALELAQANGCTKVEAHQLVDYVFNRPIGEVHQEVGGVMVTLAALCSATYVNMDLAARDELSRVRDNIDKIRAKWQAKPKNSPLPQHSNHLDESANSGPPGDIGKDLTAEIERRNQIIEADLKRSMRINMPGISADEQESAWQNYKRLNNL